ncbi:acyl CoA:acetate/3-ketoacid CoA transferase [Mycolicibacterium smegmatis]|uniref:acyl CoA:acetate/3-ketoacid CoA transferase n=1 Tax=Mycolicibacterium smegmatis TaxID=1772 RepID=UPI001EFB2096|nr:CoA-transferase [Mycolicibacterium smegmatis]ULN38796.1 acyl CoA:acetate/3-ketoacid CoA transferase [Mycolicibacterium smegmatis]
MRLSQTVTPEFLSAQDAVDRIPDRARLLVEASGGGVIEPSGLLDALADRYRRTGGPGQLAAYFCSGIGNRSGSGMDVLALPGLLRSAIAGHWAMTPTLSQMAHDGDIEAYNLPQGVLAQLLRESAAKRPGLITKVGLGTFCDPRQGGGRLNSATTTELVQIMEINGEEYLFYPSPAFDVAFIRGTTADEHGNLTMEHETAKLGVLAAATATRNSGGLVIAQVKRVAAAHTLDPKSVVVPGHLIDIVVVQEDQWQTAINEYNPAFSGEVYVPFGRSPAMPHSERKVVARRALDEIRPASVVNLGVGMADGVATAALEEGRLQEITLTVEQGMVGGVPERGVIFGVSWNPEAVIEHASQFDFYDGGGLDVACLGFAEVDREGNVNSSLVDGRIFGAGGFINISQSAKKVVFCGTLTAGGLTIDLADGYPKVTSEGRHRKFIDKVRQITFNAHLARERGQEVIYVTERAVFTLGDDGPVLTEVAPGWTIDQVIALMDFRPKLADDVRLMSGSLFSAATRNPDIPNIPITEEN